MEVNFLLISEKYQIEILKKLLESDYWQHVETVERIIRDTKKEFAKTKSKSGFELKCPEDFDVFCRDFIVVKCYAEAAYLRNNIAPDFVATKQTEMSNRSSELLKKISSLISDENEYKYTFYNLINSKMRTLKDNYSEEVLAEKFAVHLRETLSYLSMSQADFAKTLEVDPSVISKLLNKKIKSRKVLEYYANKISDHLHKPVDVFWETNSHIVPMYIGGEDARYFNQIFLEFKEKDDEFIKMVVKIHKSGIDNFKRFEEITRDFCEKL